MTKTSTGLRLAIAALASGLAATLAPAAAQAAPAPTGTSSFPAVIDLPNGFQPEGIAIRGNTAYLGSLADGDIYAVNLRTGEGMVLSEGPGTPSVGLKVDNRGRLFVAGGPAGDARVVDTRTGEVLATYQLGVAGASFINDVVLTRDAAWFTDSFNAVLYKLPLGEQGELPDASQIVAVPLSGDYVHVAGGFNLNGIAATPNRKTVLAVQSSTGLLFRIDQSTGVATTVDLGGYLLTNGDGLLVRGRKLYVVQNRMNQVAVFKLNRGATAGTLLETLTDPDFDVPTTVAAKGAYLYLPNARFGTPDPATATYTLVRVKR